MLTVGQVLRGKPAVPLVTIGPHATVQCALEIMAQQGISSLPVLDGGELIGILSERDYTRRAVPKRIAPWEVRVRDVMTRGVVCVGMQEPLRRCVQLMIAQRIRHLPVADNDRLVGMVSVMDVLEVLRSAAGITPP